MRAKDREIAPELDALCVAATAVSRDERLPTARELAERIERFLDGDRDVALRRSLARDHLEKARAAFDVDRGTAMREAAGALALDPQLAAAAELVGRLMLEPPRDTPAEVIEIMRTADVHDAKAIGRAGIWTVIGALCFIPLLWYIAPHDTYIVQMLALMFIVDGFIAYGVVRAKKPRPGLIVITNMIIVIAISRAFSPILIAPGVAASLAMAMVLTPRFSWIGHPITIGVAMVGGVILPLILESIGTMSRTMSVSDAGILFRAPAISGAHEAATIAVGGLYAAALIVGAAIAGYQMRVRALEATKRLQLQAWQLRQLVPRA